MNTSQHPLCPRRPRSLYVACPVLALLLAAVHQFMPEGLTTHTLYGAVLLAALPTWDRAFLERLTVLSSLLILLAEALEVAAHLPGAIALANASIGLLVVWGALHLCGLVLETHERQLRPAVEPTASGDCNCGWRGRMLTMCAWSKQMKDEGSWVPIEDFFNRHFRIRISHGVCEQIRDELIAQTGPQGARTPRSAASAVAARAA